MVNKCLFHKPKQKPEKKRKKKKKVVVMETSRPEVYFVFMNFDPEYERLRADRTKQGAQELDLYLSNKHDELLAKTFRPGTYKKRFSWVIIDGFAVEITDDQAKVLRSTREVRVVEKNQELS